MVCKLIRACTRNQQKSFVGRGLLGGLSLRWSEASFYILLLIGLMGMSWSQGHAQAVSATLLGSVNDQTGANIPHAKVVIQEISTGISHELITNESGNYTFPDLPPGSYSITAEANGFKKETRPSVDIIVNTATRVDFNLQPGSATETITVTDVPPILQTDRADVSTKFETQNIEAAPLSVNRNFQGLLNLVPGTTPAQFQHSQFFNAQSSLQTEANGVPRMGNSYQIEGIDDDERTGLLQIMIPPADAIQTVDISTNNFEAELGRAIGAVTNVTLKSGSNAFHGSASEYLQNTAFNARSYFSSKVGHVAYNYFGGNVSGPIIKNKLFFYGDYYRNSDHEANSNTLSIPPTQFYTDTGNGYYDLSGGLTTNASGQTVGQIYDPATGNPDGSGRTPFPNNHIPINRVDPISVKLLRLLQAPNQTATLASPINNFFIVLPFQKTADTYDVKIDAQLTAKDHLSGRYSYQKVNTFQAPAFGSAGGGPAQGAFQGTGLQNAYSTGLNYDRAFSSTLLTEARFGVAHYHSNSQPSDYGSNDASTIGIPGVNISQFTSGQVGVNLSDFVAASTTTPLIGYAASMPWRRGEANIDFVNHWTKIMGNHTIKFGADLRRVQDNLLQDQTFSPRGLVTFSENQSSELGAQPSIVNQVASFLLDVPSQVGRDVNSITPAYRQWWLFAFAGDKWQASSKLTVDMGLRWEFYPPATPGKSGGFSNYDPTTNSLVIAGVGGNPSNLGMETRYRYFAPRTGFAYRANERTVIRGGFGISYMPFPDNTYAYNYPVRANNSYQSLNSYTPSLLDNGQPFTFAGGFPAPVSANVPSSGIIRASGPLLNQSYVVIPKVFKNPYVESWNVAVQQSLPAQFNLQISYVANHGVGIASSQNINLPSALNQGTAGEPEYIAYKRSAATNLYFLGNSSNYQSLQVQLTRRFTNGLATATAFTWGKGLGYQDADDGGLHFWLDQRHNYAPNDYDRRLNFEESFTYELPFGKGKPWLNQGFIAGALGGWKLSGIISIVSGAPFTVSANGGTINTPGQTQTANLVKPFHALHGIGSGKSWFDTSSFAQPVGCTGKQGTPCPIAYGTSLGNSGRNQFYGPGFIQDNISAFKTFPIWESLSLETRVDAFQLSNTPQFSNPGASLTNTATFGYVTSTTSSGSGVNGTGGGRTLQLSGTFRF